MSETESAEPWAAQSSALHIAVGARHPADVAQYDDWLSGHETDRELSDLFASWLPPARDELDRLAAAFGRAEIAPLIVSLRDTLCAAVTMLAVGERCDAHRLSGLTGTLSFAAASRAWRDLDEGAEDADARRTSRAAIVAISRWLEDDPSAVGPGNAA